jgi:hypothetical protein
VLELYTRGSTGFRWRLGESFVVGTKKMWWRFFCVDCLPVWGQLMLALVRFARLFGRLFPSYRAPMLCLSKGPFSIGTEVPISCSPAHLLQVTTMLYSVVEATLPSRGIFSCIMGLRFLGSLSRCIKSNAQIQCRSGNTQEI